MLKRQTSWTRRDSSSASRSSSSKRIQSERRRTSNRRKSDLIKDSREDAEETRRKKAKRKKRAPLLDPSILDAIYSVMGGHVQRRARPFWLAKFAPYENGERPGTMTRESFRKCLDKMGIQFDTREQYEALADCFTSPNGDNEAREDRDTSAKDTNEMQGVDYTAFVDFACNIRDSRKLREIADSLRQSISLYDGKQPSSSSYNLAAKFARIDRHQRGWISSSQFERVFQRQTKTGPSFHLSPTQLQTLVNRFEFEYEKQQLGVDYMQFAQWLQPLLHLNVEKVHARVKGLIEHACRKQGWKVDDVFQAMDEDRNGEIDALELKQALLEMGLPLTDAQIRCLTDEYDVNGDGKVQYNEFVLFFGVSERSKQRESNKETSRQDRGNTVDRKKKRKDMQTKRNVRNSFSWGITKAFARKQTANARNRPSASERQGDRQRQDSISSEESDNLRLRHGKEQYDSSSEETFDRKDVIKQKKRRSENQLLESSDDDEDEDEKQQLRLSNPHNRTRLRTRGRARHAAPSQRSVALSSTESDRNPSRKGNKQRERRRKCTSKRPTSDDERKNQDSSSSRASNGLSTSWSGANDEEKKIQARRTQHLTSALTVRRRQQRQRAARDGRSNSSSDGRKSVRPRKKCTISRSRQKRKNYRTTLRRNEIDEAASSSGLDVEQLRRRQRAKRQREREDKRRDEKDQESDEEENEDEDKAWSRSDQEYHKHLKHSLRRAFDFFDLNQTSTIDKRELSHVLRALGHDVTSKALDVAMDRADLDRNGALDFYEFVAFVKHQLGQAMYCLTPQREMEIRQCFQSLDRDQNGALDEQEFEYLMYKVLQIELAIEEQHALLEFIDQDGDGVISEEEFIEFMKTLEACHRKYGAQDSGRQHKRFLASLDPSSQLAYSAMKKIVRGVPTDIDRSLLMFFGIPSNFRPAISSAATCRTLHGNTMEHVLSFPSPQTIEALALDTRLTDKKESSWFTLTRLDTESEEYRMLQLAENVEAQAIVSLKRAAGVPKPFDTRENDVVKRCVHVCLFQEQEGVSRTTRASRSRRNEAKNTRAGTVVGNVHEVPVYWHEGEEDVWEFSKKATKQDKYKFLVRTNAVNDRLYVLVEFIVHLQLNPDEHQLKPSVQQHDDEEEENGGSETRIREMVCCWCKIPVRQLLAKRVTIVRRKEKLWGGTANAPIDIEHDELLRRRTGWRALTNMFTKPSLPLMGIKSVPIDVLADDLQLYVRKMPPMVIAPFVALPILAEYMGLMRKTLACVANSSSVMTCEPALKLLPKIVDDDAALSIFRKAFDDEVAGMKPGEDRDLKFQQLVLRMWPSFVQWQEPLPSALLASENVPHATNQLETLVYGSLDAFHLKNEHDRERATQMRLQLLQTTVSGKLRLQDVRVVSTPFHVREVAFRRLL